MKVTQYTFPGQLVSLEHSAGQWVATGWEQGLPVARRPIPADKAQHLLRTLPHHQRTYQA